jgi:hypothetical protein
MMKLSASSEGGLNERGVDGDEWIDILGKYEKFYERARRRGS